MADTLIAGTTLVEKESRSIGDIPIGGITEWDDTFANLPEGYVECDGATITDPLSSYNGSAVPNLNTNYRSIPAKLFRPGLSTTTFDNNGDYDMRNTVAGARLFFADAALPHGATITAAAVYGTDTGNTWELRRLDVTNEAVSASLATAVIDTEDTTISNAVVDNNTYSYMIFVADLGQNDAIAGARITYTPRFKFIIRIR